MASHPFLCPLFTSPPARVIMPAAPCSKEQVEIAGSITNAMLPEVLKVCGMHISLGALDLLVKLDCRIRIFWLFCSAF